LRHSASPCFGPDSTPTFRTARHVTIRES
jgi:hypothetical protein